MIVKFEIRSKPDGYTTISVYEYNRWRKQFDTMPYMATSDYFIETVLDPQELKYYKAYKKSRSKRGFYYGIIGRFPNPSWQHILGTASRG